MLTLVNSSIAPNPNQNAKSGQNQALPAKVYVLIGVIDFLMMIDMPVLFRI